MNRYPCVLQNNTKDCGPAALATVCQYYQVYHPLVFYKELMQTDENGTNIYSIVQTAEKIGFKAEALTGTIDDLTEGISNEEINFPFIAHTITQDNLEHYIVIFDITDKKILVSDPGKGRCKISFEEFESLWTGNLIELDANSLEKVNKKTNRYLKMYKAIGIPKKDIVTVILLSVLISILSITGTFKLKAIIDSTTSITDINILVVGFISLVLLYVVVLVFNIVRGTLLAKISSNIDTSIAKNYYESYLSMSMYYSRLYKTGDYLSRFTDAMKIRNVFSGVVLATILNSIMIIFGISALLIVSIKLTIAIGIVIASILFIVFKYRKQLTFLEKNIMEENSEITSFLKESFSNLEHIKYYQLENTLSEKFLGQWGKLQRLIIKIGIMDNNKESIIQLLQNCGNILVFSFGVLLVVNEQLTLGSLISLTLLYGLIIEPIMELANMQREIQSINIAMNRMEDVTLSKAEDVTSGEVLESIDNIDIQNLSFGFGYRKDVLHNISFHVKKGEKIGIVGESGSGKTTLGKLLTGIYEVPENNIYFNDNVDINKVSKANLREKIAIINQESIFFSGTIYENITSFDKKVTESEVIRLCKNIDMHNWILKFQFGYNTVIEENGRNLSSGQKQLLSFVRALVKKPDLILLDEVTSNLDSVTQKKVEKVIDHLKLENVTCIVIAHRLQTVANANTILVMSEGEVIECGNNNELLQLNGHYSQLINSM